MFEEARAAMEEKISQSSKETAETSAPASSSKDTETVLNSQSEDKQPSVTDLSKLEKFLLQRS